jgi:hypothetical protein
VALADLRTDKGRCIIVNVCKERIDIMSDKTFGLDREEDLLIGVVSDEALEIAAGTAKEKANFTLGACSGLSVCPG